METYQIILIVIYFVINAILATLLTVSILIEEDLTLDGLIFIVFMLFFGIILIILGFITSGLNSLKWKK